MPDTVQRIQERFNRACVRYGLLADGDRILVALSGGKDSLELLRLMSARARIFRPSITVEAAHVIMDNIPYETDTNYLSDFCNQCGVTLHILHSHFDESTDPRKTKCFLCAWNRRKALFEFARDNNFNKVALGHHLDDFLVTFLMNITYEGSTQSMQPSLKLQHYPVTIIRPLSLVDEADIRQIAEQEGFHKQKCQCPYEGVTKRQTMTELLHHIETLNPEARSSLWHAIEKDITKAGNMSNYLQAVNSI